MMDDKIIDDSVFYRDYGETDDDGNAVVSILYVTDGYPVSDIEIGQKHLHDDTGIKVSEELAKSWGLTTD